MTTAQIIPSPLGLLYLEADELGITQIRLARDSDVLSSATSAFLEQAQVQLQEYFDGKRKVFDLVLRPKGTDFQRRVWQELQQIPFGKAISYLELSKRLSDVKAIRAAASANGKNPILIAIPCHRVIGSDGALVGFSAGLHHKKWLLHHESESKQQSLF